MQTAARSGGIASSRKGWVRWAFAGIFILLLLGVFLVPLALGWYWFSGPGSYYGWPVFFPFGFLFIILIFFVGFRLLFWGWGGRRGYYGGWDGYQSDSLEILNHRYARGEITKEQYDQMKKDIQQKP